MSETAKAREILARFCVGQGIDIGSQGDPIVPWAVSFDLPEEEYSIYSSGQAGGTVTCRGDARELPFENEKFDWVYSSHLLEDFPPEQTLGVILEWWRVIKNGGKLILLLPDEPIFFKHCLDTGQTYNHAHKNHVLTLSWFKENIVPKIPGSSIIFDEFPIEIYSFTIVLKKSD